MNSRHAKLFVAAAFCLPLFMLISDLPAQEAEFTVAGFSIAREDPDNEYGGSMVQGLNSGTRIFLRARLSDKTVIKIRRLEDKLMKITDSTGKQLADSGGNFGFMADISGDGKTIDIPIGSSDVPGSGADSINVKGSVMLECGENSRTEEVDVKIASGEKVKFAGIDFEVSDLRDSFMDDDAQSIEFQCKTSPARIQKIEAVTGDGKTFELSQSGSGEFGFGNNISYSRNYDVKGKAEDIKQLKVTYFQDVKEVELPLDVKFGLGF